MNDIPEDERRRIEKISLFGLRYGTQGKKLSRIIARPTYPWYTRLWQKIFGIRCVICRVKLDRRYWNARQGRVFAALMHWICMDSHRCVECKIQEERLEREGHS